MIVYADALSQDAGPIRYAYEPYRIAPGRPTMLAGCGGSRKTWLAQMILLRKAAGGHECSKGKAMHLDFEQGQRTTATRYQRLAKASGVDLAKVGKSLGYQFSPTAFRHIKDDVEKARDTLCFLVEGWDLVMVDPLKACCPWIDENSAQARDPLDLMTYASEKTGAAFLVLDHSGKPQDGRGLRFAVRGSSAKVDACQVVYVATCDSPDDPTQVTCIKENLSGDFVRPFRFVVEDVAKDGDAKWGAMITEPKMQVPKQAAPRSYQEEF